MTLSEYITQVNLRLDTPLSDFESRWARNAWDGDIPPHRFAGWLALTAKSVFLPLSSVPHQTTEAAALPAAADPQHPPAVPGGNNP